MPEKFRRGIVYCCIIFGDRKTLDKRGGGVSRFSVENFSSHSEENFRGGILYCCINFGNRKGLDRKGRELQGIPSNIFCLTVPKIFVGEPFSVALISGIEKVWIGRGEYQDFPSKNFCLTVLKISLGESFTVALISVSEKVWIRRVGVSLYSVENFLSHSAEKFRRGILYCCSNFGYRESLDRTGR